MTTHQHEQWQLEEAADGSGLYCKACGQSVPPRCPLCNEPVVAGSFDARPIACAPRLGVTIVSKEWAHRECLLRSVLGGIGHLEDHQRWCIEAGDPDGGRSYRQSALEVDEWVHRYGI